MLDVRPPFDILDCAPINKLGAVVQYYSPAALAHKIMEPVAIIYIQKFDLLFCDNTLFS